MSNPELPGRYRPDPRRDGRIGGSPADGDGRFLARGGQAENGTRGRSADRGRAGDGWDGLRGGRSPGAARARPESAGRAGRRGQDGGSRDIWGAGRSLGRRAGGAHRPDDRGPGSGRGATTWTGWLRKAGPAGRPGSSGRNGGGPYDVAPNGGGPRRLGTTNGRARPGQLDERGGVALRSREGLRLGPGGGLPPPGGYGLPGRSRRNGPGGGGWNGGGGRPRRKGDWWRHWTWKKAAAVAAIATGLVVIAASGAIGIAYAKTPIPNIEAAAQQQASTVYFADGKTVVGHFGSVNRQMLNYGQIPALVRNAVVAAEDKNFWHEGGISLTGILRAAYYDVTSSGGNLQGGSTITQQLVRNYYQGIGTAQTLTRKIKEIFVAEKLAKAKPKEWILAQYMNTVYFGDGAYGIGAAAQTYFGVQPTQLKRLTPAQAAMLAAMIQSPSYYSPDPAAGAPYKGLVYRWHYVLGAMVNLGAISQAVANQQRFPAVVKEVNNGWGGYRGYIMNRVRYELETVYGYTWPQIENDGLHIYTTVSRRLTSSLYAAVRQNQTLMRHNNPPTGISPGVTPDGLPSYVRIGALLEQPSTGAILAMYGGQSYNKNQFDNALQSRNQVGSSFKPYVLATAVQQGMNVRTSRLNGYSPLWIPPDSQPMSFARIGHSAPPGGYNWYQVFNDEVSNPDRPVSVVEATAMSLNTSYTDLWHRVAYNASTGRHPVVDMASAFGVDTQASGLQTMRDQAGTALGQASLTVAEQAGMIATLANNGVWHTQHMIAKIVQGNTAIPAKVSTREVLTPAQAADVDYAMSFDTSPMGTAAGLGLTNGQTIIAKTGTTNLAQSAFFLGATQKDAMAVGMFVNNPKCPHRLAQLCHSQAALSYAPPKGLETLFGVGGYAGYGGQWPTQIWHTFFMKNFNSGTPIAWPPVNNDGTAWNLVGKLPRHHHKPKPKGRPGPRCNGNGKKCHGNPGPTFTPTPTPPPSATPTPTSTCPPGTFCRTPSPNPTRTKHGGAGGTSGPLALAVIAAAVPTLPFASSRLWGRRQRRRLGR